MPGSPVELKFSGPAQPECLDQLHDLLARLWAQHPGVSELDQMMFTTAVLEVGNNILTHGAPTRLSVALSADASQLRAELSDDGAPARIDLQPAALPDDAAESGRGLAMIQMAVHEVTHTYVNDCNHWHLLRHRVTTTG